jgi:hypothetical protein
MSSEFDVGLDFTVPSDLDRHSSATVFPAGRGESSDEHRMAANRRQGAGRFLGPVGRRISATTSWT